MENLYHYTSMQGFESIIKSQNIRMTRSDFMNDPNDCKVFYNIVKKYIKEKMEDIDIEHYLRNVGNKSKIFSNDVGELIKRYPLNEYLDFVYNHISMYVFSMTDRKDSLPMWNYYGNDGICIGFEKDAFLEKFSQNMCKTEFDFLAYTKVNYIDVDTELIDLPLDSLNDIQLLKKTDEGKVSFYENLLLECKKDDEKINLELFVESYIESYIVSINYLLRAPKEKKKTFEEFHKINSGKEFYHKMFLHNRDIKIKEMKFKSHIDIFMLILSAKYKPKTFENESETRIVLFNYDIVQDVDEQYTTIKYDFGSFMKPFIENKKDTEDKKDKEDKEDEEDEEDETWLSNEVKSIVLSPSTKRIPIENNKYKEIIRRFLNKDDSFNIESSKHDIRW